MKVRSYSQAKQDLFVLCMTSYKTDGFYLEVGGSDPININNTYILENDYHWRGISLEINEECVRKYNSIRKNKCYLANALETNFSELLSTLNAPLQIDYLSIDIEPAKNTLKCLMSLPHKKHRFSVVTFEHEFYSEGPAVRDESRKFMSDLGYQIVVSDLKNLGNSYEDWYVDPLAINESVWKKFQTSNVEYSLLSL